MRSPGSVPRSLTGTLSRTSVALDNLRGIVILIVLAVHSTLAYLQSTPARGSDFDQPPYNWRSLPIVDSHRFFGFDLFCAWQDIYLMALLFFLSGLFVWPSLNRKKTPAFLRDRALRLGIPYAVWDRHSHSARNLSVLPHDGGRSERGGLLAQPDRAAVLAQRPTVVRLAAPGAECPGGRPEHRRTARDTGTRPLVGCGRQRSCALFRHPSGRLGIGLRAARGHVHAMGMGRHRILRSAILPSLQYAIYFFAGVGLGATGIERGLLAADGVLPRHWPNCSRRRSSRCSSGWD